MNNFVIVPFTMQVRAPALEVESVGWRFFRNAKDVLVNFRPTQQFSYIFEVAAHLCEFVRNFTR